MPSKTETREEMISRWEEQGLLDPKCPGCQVFYQSPCSPSNVFAPRHNVCTDCKGTKQPHCTCDGCF